MPDEPTPAPRAEPPADDLADAFQEALESEQRRLARMPSRSYEELKQALLAFLRQLPDAPPEEQVPLEGPPFGPDEPAPPAT
jgi:hypothetical protein